MMIQPDPIALWSMIRKSVQRFSEKIMLKELKRDVDTTQNHRALV
jgi:hypothetical protein